MDPQTKKDFMMRVEAEKHLIETLQQGKDDYEPCNYYGRFIQQQLDLMEGPKRVTKKWLRRLYYQVWLSNSGGAQQRY